MDFKPRFISITIQSKIKSTLESQFKRTPLDENLVDKSPGVFSVVESIISSSTSLIFNLSNLSLHLATTSSVGVFSHWTSPRAVLRMLSRAWDAMSRILCSSSNRLCQVDQQKYDLQFLTFFGTLWYLTWSHISTTSWGGTCPLTSIVNINPKAICLWRQWRLPSLTNWQTWSSKA